jgi:ABC-type transport system involved in multi-copper enzyme maturation permease subunit
MMKAALGFAWITFRNLAAGKRVYAAAFLLLLPPGLALIIAAAGKGVEGLTIFQHIAFFYTLWFMVFLLSLIFGIALSSGEIEDGTVGYLYLGAAPRWLIVLIQIGVTSLVLTALIFLSLVLTALGASLRGGLPHFWRDIGACTLVGGTGTLIALSFYLTCGLAFRSPLAALAASVLPTFFWELMVTWWPVRFAAWTVTNNLRSLLLSLLFEGRRAPPYRYVRNFQLPEYGEAALFLSLLAGLFLAAAMVAAMNRSIEGKEAR